MQQNLARRGGADRLLFRSPKAVQGRTLAAVASERELDPVDAAIALILEGHSPGVISFNMHEEDIARFMRQPFTVTSTDGGLPAMDSGRPHPRTYGAFARKLRKYVREEGVLDLPGAIARMSGTAAQMFRLEDRGTLRPGMAADIVVFDFERVNDPATFEEPHQLSEGMVYVLVNGVLAIDRGAFTAIPAGKVLRHRRKGPD
jgi:N-acyl-D-amino-acid deacylase